MAADTFAELMAKSYWSVQQDYAAQSSVKLDDWERIPLEDKKEHILVMADFLAKLGLLGLHVKLEGDTVVVTVADGRPVKPLPRSAPVEANLLPAKATRDNSPQAHAIRRQKGYTGNFCPECQSDKMVQNGSCEKCEGCGATSGCS